MLSAINGDLWTVGGLNVRITAATEVKGTLQIGDRVKVHARPGTDGVLVAREVELAVRDDNDDNRPGEQEFTGVLSAINGDVWTIGGVAVRVTAGTDWFEPDYGETLPHTHDELALLVEFCGFTPMQALLAGTRDGAAALGLQDRTGTVEVGKSADLMVLTADPLADIRNTRKLRMTVRAGQVLLPEAAQR